MPTTKKSSTPKHTAPATSPRLEVNVKPDALRPEVAELVAIVRTADDRTLATILAGVACDDTVRSFACGGVGDVAADLEVMGHLAETDADATQVINAYFHLANRLRAVQAVSDLLAEHARKVSA